MKIRIEHARRSIVLEATGQGDKRDGYLHVVGICVEGVMLSIQMILPPHAIIVHEPPHSEAAGRDYASVAWRQGNVLPCMEMTLI